MMTLKRSISPRRIIVALLATLTYFTPISSTEAFFNLPMLKKNGAIIITAADIGTTAVNLTTEGTTDWIHFGDGSLMRKNGGGSLISTYTKIGSGSVNTYYDDPRVISWTDGTPTASSTSNPNGIFTDSAVGRGFSLTAPATSSAYHTLIVHFGGWHSKATFTISLSDGSANPVIYTTAGDSNGDGFAINLTIKYKSASPTATLTVKYVIATDYGTGNVAISGAAYQ